MPNVMLSGEAIAAVIHTTTPALKLHAQVK
jgi:hypothetical protein